MKIHLFISILSSSSFSVFICLLQPVSTACPWWYLEDCFSVSHLLSLLYYYKFSDTVSYTNSSFFPTLLLQFIVFPHLQYFFNVIFCQLTSEVPYPASFCRIFRMKTCALSPTDSSSIVSPDIGCGIFKNLLLRYCYIHMEKYTNE